MFLTAHSVKRNPVNYVSLIDDINIKTPGHRVHAHSHFDLIFTLHNGEQKIRLQLEPNHDLLHETFSITYLGEDGRVKSIEPVDRRDNKVFKGNAFVQRNNRDDWINAGWARITMHRDGKEPLFEGTFRLNGDHHHVQTGSNYQRLKHDNDPAMYFDQDSNDVMIVWRDSDIQSFDADHPELKRDIYGQSLCDSDTLGFNSRYHEESLQAVDSRSLFGRQSIDGGSSGNNGAGVNLVETIGSVDGCPTTRKVALVGIATDCTYTADFNSSETLRQNVISQVNAASQVYESTFNISLGIQNLTISDKNCPGTASSSAPWNIGCSSSTTLADRLNLFSGWRGQFEDTNAYWTLLSTCNTDSAVGLAWLGQVCRSGSSDGQDGSGNNETIAAANVVVRTSTEWQVFAHESGHTFGAVHDCDESACPVNSTKQSCCPLSSSSCDADGKFIMNPSTASGIKNFSPCSIGNICSGFKRNIKSDCFTDNKNIKTITGKQCGNGIVEEDEDCDCGGETGCGDNSCCDAKTCKFKGSAVCDPSNEDCCTDKCQFSSSGTICRASTGACDPEEQCSGSSASCPVDAHKDDGEGCGDGLKCASGQCTSRDLQCQNMVGNLTSNDDDVSACGGSGCLLSCKSPEFGSNTCVNMNQNFLDGTSCGGGGKCSNGACKGASTLKEIQEWFEEHKNIAIPVGCVIGALILIGLISCCVSTCKRCASRRKAPKPAEMSGWPSNYRGDAPSRQWGPVPAPNAPPAYSYAPIEDHNQQWGRGRSMRYA